MPWSECRATNLLPKPIATRLMKIIPCRSARDQTISQPYIVALMLQALALSPTDKVLEVGTGSGYVTALLAELAAQVVSVERHAALADEARRLIFRAWDIPTCELSSGTEVADIRNAAPYNAILVSAAAPEVPQALFAQLAEGGRMIIPVGGEDSQQLQLIQMRNGLPQTSLRELCRFVPLVPGEGS